MTQLRAGSLTISLLLLLAGCTGGGSDTPADGAAQAVEVEPLVVAPRSQQIMSDLPGRIAPVRVAEVRARVAGIVKKRHFTEGATVKAGDLLFTIEPTTFEAALARAKGALARAQAQVKQAESVVKRFEPLVKVEAVSRQEYDDAVAALLTAQAGQVSAQAEVKTAQLDLDYATVRAPISGRIGRSLTSEGSLVGQGKTTPMALIQQMDPIYADFSQPVNALIRLREAVADGKLVAGDPAQPNVVVRVDGTRHTAKGHLLFSDVTVDQSTGQVMLRAKLPNPQGMLLPGMFVRVSAEQGTDEQAIFIPQRAVSRGSDGTAKVLVVSAEGTAQERPVKTGVMQDSQWQITEGLKSGDQLIVDGADKIPPGSPVMVKQARPVPQANKPAH